jgi:hypothetical protein
MMFMCSCYVSKAAGHMGISRENLSQLIGKHSPILCSSNGRTFTTKGKDAALFLLLWRILKQAN